MWDNAPLLRTIANALFAFSALTMLYGAGSYIVHLPGLFPVYGVHLKTVPERVVAEQVQQVVRSEVSGNIFTVDIERLRQSLEKLPWVRSVKIAREFPHQLAVQLEEHHALARWNNAALVNQQGEVFVAKTEQQLPDFIGQDGSSMEVAHYYNDFSQQLAALNLQATQVTLSARHAWQLQLSNGMVLELGRDDMQQRLARFVAAYPDNLATMQGGMTHVDLRYRNGFAVGGINKG